MNPAEIGANYFRQRIEFGRKENIPLTNELLALHVTGAVLVAVSAERDRIVALIRAEAADNKGMAWFHPEHSLTALADRIQGTT